jgi:hypothetical protein
MAAINAYAYNHQAIGHWQGMAQGPRLAGSRLRQLRLRKVDKGLHRAPQNKNHVNLLIPKTIKNGSKGLH